MKRRTLLQMTAAGAGLTAMQAVSAAESKTRKKKKLTFRNKSFYTDGKFDVEKGKDAIVTEVANVHTDSAVRHSDKEMNDFFLKG